MVTTDGRPTIASPRPFNPAGMSDREVIDAAETLRIEVAERGLDSCPLATLAPERVKQVRLASNRATPENIAALRARYPNADIVIPRRAA